MDSRGRPRVQTEFNDESLTVQSDRELADINKTMEKFRRTGIVQGLDRAEGQFRDVTTFEDYADVMRTVKAAEGEFMKLPSKVREIFNHDAAEWLDTAHDEDKRQALVEAGFIEAPPVVGAEALPEGGAVEEASPAETPGD